MRISLVAALDCNFCIGKDGKLPWPRLPRDMARFRNLTMGRPIIMGRKTFDSIGKALDGRTNAVLTKNLNQKKLLEEKGCMVLNSFIQTMNEFKDDHEIFIIGGETIYRQFIPFADRMYLTFVRAKFDDGDTFFPLSVEELLENWLEDENRQEYYGEDEDNDYDLLFQVFNKKQKNLS